MQVNIEKLKLIKAHFHEKIRLKKERIKSLFVKPNKKPIFILGNQKSGTSAICGLLGEATNSTYVIDFVGAWSPYISNLINNKTPMSKFIKQNSWAFSHQIIKEPNLTFVASKLVTAFPNSDFIYVVRNPFDNIRSILNRLNMSGKCSQIDDFSNFNETWTSILKGTDLGIESNNPIEVLATRWNCSIKQYLENPNRFILVRYEDFNLDKVGCIKKLASNTHLPFSNDIKSLTEKNFQPKGDNSQKILDYFGEKNHKLIKENCLSNWFEIEKQLSLKH
jgi:hypothetical protein